MSIDQDRREPTDAGGSPDDDLLAELFDSLLQDVLDGKTIDVDRLLPERPDLKSRVRDTWELACSVAGRREPGRPVLGGYEIVRELGRGGMGTVYLARHHELGREVAIKVLPQSLALSPRAKRRFLEEARALARLRHDNVVHIHRIVDHSEMLAFEMEFVEGPSLQSLLAELRGLGGQPQTADLARGLGLPLAALGARSPVEFFVKLGIAIARALAEVHRSGLVHRDVKPSNILLRKNGTPVLADFGLAQEHDPTSTQTVSFAGTPIYAAPERLRNGDLELDGRADVYSLGVSLYEAITLAPPYQGRTTQEVLRKIESGAAVPLRRRAPHVSRDLQTVLHKAMEVDPRRRYATADEFADDLERLLALQPIRARPKGPLRRTWLWMHRQRKVVAAGSAGAVLVALLSWPVLAHAREAATASDRAKQHRLAAHYRLLEPECIDLVAWNRRDPTQNSVAIGSQTAALRAVVASYDAALQAMPEDAALRRERAAVATALWLRTESPSRPEFSAAARASQGFLQVVADLPPVARHAAAMLVDGSIDLAQLRLELDTADAEDRFASGLLAALLGDVAACEAAWVPLDGTEFAHPLLDAGLGRLFAADGFPERAYPRLFHATRSFPGAAALTLELADAALATGEVQLAEQWLAHPSVAAAPPPGDTGIGALRRQRLAADLAAQKGDRALAEASYRRILGVWPKDVTARHRLATLALERGDLRRAEVLLQQLLADSPDHAPARLDLARIALLRHDRASYLAQARYALAQARSRDRSRGANDQFAEILRLGGMRVALQEATGGVVPLRTWRHVEPAQPMFRDAKRLQSIEQCLSLLADFDRTAARVAIQETHPVRAAFRVAREVALDHPATLTPLGLEDRAALAIAWPVIVDLAALVLPGAMVPLQTNLGTPLQILDFQPVALPAPPTAEVDCARTLATVGWLDGSEHVVVGHVPRRDTDGDGYVEIRAADVETLLHTLPSPRSGLMFGYSLADVGDIDGDGYRDLAVGAPQSRNNPEVSAAVFLYSGQDWSLLRELRGSDSVAFGVAVVGTGDVDGDGTPDLAIGTTPFRKSTLALGSATLFSGRTGSVIRTHHGDRAGAAFGAALTAGSDLDGDGCGDLVVGGSLGGTPVLVRAYSGRTGAELFTIDGSGLGHDFGRSLLLLGDQDGDGTDDIAIAAPDIGGRDREPGRVAIHSGKNGARLREVVGDAADDHFGAAICRLPDWCGDRHPAFAVGADHGGVSGNGYARVFDRQSLRPLQSFFVSPEARVFGAALSALGPHDSRGRPRLLSSSTSRDRGARLWPFWFSLDLPTTQKR